MKEVIIKLKERIPAIIVCVLIVAYVYLLVYSVAVDIENEKVINENLELKTKIATQKTRIDDLMLECKNEERNN